MAQRAGWPGLEADQQDLLSAIGIEPDPELVAAEAKPKISHADRFQQGLAALAAFVGREGHVRVPRPHKELLKVPVAGPGGEENVETVKVGLGAWLNNQKARRAKPSAARRTRRGVGIEGVLAGAVDEGTVMFRSTRAPHALAVAAASISRSSHRPRGLTASGAQGPRGQWRGLCGYWRKPSAISLWRASTVLGPRRT
ncbi:helicase associated domain-containing protein [Kitasatospora sp. NPDC085879]|uniref:helicase associated domain-containing protein n=1 Tax=Kitasatospora sp. NPDC085879 TaxID=3154769 RepID=UPI00343EC485